MDNVGWRVFLKWGYPTTDGFKWKAFLKWMIWGDHHFRKPPNMFKHVIVHGYVRLPFLCSDTWICIPLPKLLMTLVLGSLLAQFISSSTGKTGDGSGSCSLFGDICENSHGSWSNLTKSSFCCWVTPHFVGALNPSFGFLTPHCSCLNYHCWW